jgi:hypothetical protein
MAIEFTLRCDGCFDVITTSKVSARDARAQAQLNLGAYCGDGRDRCRDCRAAHVRALNAQAAAAGPARSHSIGTRR